MRVHYAYTPEAFSTVERTQLTWHTTDTWQEFAEATRFFSTHRTADCVTHHPEQPLHGTQLQPRRIHKPPAGILMVTLNSYAQGLGNLPARTWAKTPCATRKQSSAYTLKTGSEFATGAGLPLSGVLTGHNANSVAHPGNAYGTHRIDIQSRQRRSPKRRAGSLKVANFIK